MLARLRAPEVDPSSKSTDALQDLLIRMRAEGKVKFDIKTGKWSKAWSAFSRGAIRPDTPGPAASAPP
jgi:hypothetical protein